MIRATDATRGAAKPSFGRAVAGLAIVATLTVAAAGTAVAATGSPAPHTELCYLIDLYHRAEPDSAAKFRLHEQIEEQLPW
jgi:hypothetical protein